jgi:hypothetical protein
MLPAMAVFLTGAQQATGRPDALLKQPDCFVAKSSCTACSSCWMLCKWMVPKRAVGGLLRCGDAAATQLVTAACKNQGCQAVQANQWQRGSDGREASRDAYALPPLLVGAGKALSDTCLLHLSFA